MCVCLYKCGETRRKKEETQVNRKIVKMMIELKKSRTATGVKVLKSLSHKRELSGNQLDGGWMDGWREIDRSEPIGSNNNMQEVILLALTN